MGICSGGVPGAGGKSVTGVLGLPGAGGKFDTGLLGLTAQGQRVGIWWRCQEFLEETNMSVRVPFEGS